jgi:hypothetical protein
MSATTDFLLSRRPAGFFLGKVLLLSEETAPQGADGHGAGYYRLIEIRPEDNRWFYHYIGKTQPKGEAIYDYHTPAQQDAWAKPSTVFPWESFWGWSILSAILILGAWWLGQSGPDAEVALPISLMMFVPMWVGGVGFAWLRAIEPVFATKVLLVWVVIQVAWGAHSRKTEQASLTYHQNQMGQ